MLQTTKYRKLEASKNLPTIFASTMTQFRSQLHLDVYQ